MTLLCPVCESHDLQAFQVVNNTPYLRCSLCLATVMSPEHRLDKQGEKDIYALHDNDVADPGYRRFLARLTEPMLRQLSPGCSGLDFGCGPGPALSRMMEEADQRMTLYDPFFYPETAVLSKQFDFVTCTEVVEHLHHPAEVFRQLDRLIRPGGLLGVMTCFQTDDDRFANWHYRRDPTHVVFYRQATMEWLASHLGWQLELPAKDVAIFHKP